VRQVRCGTWHFKKNHGAAGPGQYNFKIHLRCAEAAGYLPNGCFTRQSEAPDESSGQSPAHRQTFNQVHVVGQASRLSQTLNFGFGMRNLHISTHPLKNKSVFKDGDRRDACPTA
jgi:hypothetical protein